jgi:multisubunit Na+/H+ antiporter MnhB subunit
LQNTYPELGITDAVAGIVTDFRGTDTLFEITVFAIAGLGVMTILTLPRAAELLRGQPLDRIKQEIVVNDQEAEAEAEQDERARSRLSTPLTRLVARLALPFALLVAFSHILYGGTSPGDGFTAGVVVGLVVASWYVIFGYFEARQRLSWLVPGRLIAIGLLLGLANAFAPVLIGEGFLRIQNFGDAPADLHLTSTLIFEFSIFLTVLGSVSTIMEAIAHPREVQREYYGEEPLPLPTDTAEMPAQVANGV